MSMNRQDRYIAMTRVHFPIWMKILKAVDDMEFEHKKCTLKPLCKVLNIHYSTLSKILNELQERQYVTVTLKGQKKFVTLTSKGTESCLHIIRLVELYHEIKTY